MSYDVKELNAVTGEISTRNYTQAEKDAIAATRPSLSDRLVRIRSERNALLASTDWRDLPSYAGTKQAEWRVYRQALRDITVGLDTVEKVKAATFPTQPS